MWIEKQNVETGDATADGASTLAGAQFKITYYDGQYGTDADGRTAFDEVTAEASNATTKRTWIVQTDEDGYAELTDEEDYFVSGDSLYYDSRSKACVPLGTITIEEIKAPEGFLINEQACYIRHVTEDGAGKIKESFVIPVCDETPIRNGISITKSLVGGKIGECEGIGFYFTNSAGERVSWQDKLIVYMAISVLYCICMAVVTNAYMFLNAVIINICITA